MAERSKTAAATGKKAQSNTGTKKTGSSKPAKAPASKKATKKSAAKKAPARATTKAKSEGLSVLPGEDPWTPEELAEVSTFLEEESERLRAEISEAETDIADMLRDSNDIGGEDQADTGSKTFSREHELSLAASHREMLSQNERARSKIASGTYGECESCGNPIGKARLQAFPRATLCMTCKQREERR